MTDGKRTRITYADFEQRFFHAESPLVRVRMNRELLNQNALLGNVKIQMKTWVPSLFVAKNFLYAPWHVSLETETPVMPDTDTRPILLNRIIEEQNYVKLHHLTHIAAIREWFQSIEHHPEATHIEIVTLKISKNELFVLDGNHRLSAIIHEIENGKNPNIQLIEYRVTDKTLSGELLPDIQSLLKK